MSKLPIISGQAAVKALCRLGYQVSRQKGSHIRLWHVNKKSVTVPKHKTLGRGLLRKIIRDAEVSMEEFVELL